MKQKENKERIQKFVKFLVSKYGEDGAKKKIEKIQKTGKPDDEDVRDFLKSELTLALKALHGAKLQYIKSLKHQCAEDEELYYYKKGGSVDCGCKKKDGGEVTKAEKGTVVDKFKNRKPVPNIPTLEKNPGSTKQPMLDALKRKYHKNDYSSKTVKESQKDYDKGKGDHEVKKCGGKVKKDCGGSKLKACNGAVAKFKMHRLGGSLNGIPFMQKGTPKGGILSYLPKRPISGAEAYMNDVAINDPLYKMYTNKANAYSNEAPTISNTFNTLLNKLKAYYHGNKAAIKGYADKVDKYSRYLWNRGNYGEAIFGSPFVPIIRDYQPNRSFIEYNK